jgi:cytochrome c peroxidase
VACHQGVNVGGNMFQKFGAVGDYFKDRVARGLPMTEADRGYYNVTRQLDDMHVFKVPSLRNVAETAPYFHDASARTLAEAVDVMFKYQLGRTAPEADKAAIVSFLRTLSGKPGEQP